MRNFPTFFWQRFQDVKENNAFVYPDDEGKLKTDTYWEWSQRVQRTALGLMQAGFEADTRIGIIAPNSRAWLDIAFASWLVGGCVVPILLGDTMPYALRCLARSGCSWIAVSDRETLDRLRHSAKSLPESLNWIILDSLDDAPTSDKVHLLSSLVEEGRSAQRRGRINQLAERTYNLNAKLPALVLFDPDSPEESEGAFFSGGRLAVMLEALGRDLLLPDDARVALLMSNGWFSAALLSFATLLQGRTLAIADTIQALQSHIKNLRPTHLVCGPAYLEDQASKWLQKLEHAPEFLKKITATASESDESPLQRAISLVGERAARKVLYDPMRAEFGGALHTIHVYRGPVSGEVYELFEQAGIALLSHYGLPEVGVSHIERPGAQRRHSVGRPVEGYQCKIANAKADQQGEVLIRSDVIFDDYWSGKGPRERDELGWLHTGDTGRLESGFLFLNYR